MDFYGARDRVQLSTDVTALRLNLQDAVPLGLITNELVCNAFKHAFPDGRRGQIHIPARAIRPLSTDDDETHDGELEVSDNGIGVAKEIDLYSADSMGFDLILTLAEQLEAKVMLERNNGTTFRVLFQCRT